MIGSGWNKAVGPAMPPMIINEGPKESCHPKPYSDH